MFTITTPHQFLRHARKFFNKHPDLTSRFAEVVAGLQADPFQPPLKLHSLGGKLDEVYS